MISCTQTPGATTPAPSNSSFTPGPWEARGGLLHRQHWLIDAPGRRFIATIDGPPDEQGAANARLIATAPELLGLSELGLKYMEESLSQILESHCLLDDQLQPIRDSLEDAVRDDVSRLEEEIASARDVIAKARGAS